MTQFGLAIKNFVGPGEVPDVTIGLLYEMPIFFSRVCLTFLPSTTTTVVSSTVRIEAFGNISMVFCVSIIIHTHFLFIKESARW